jgi:uncharacterized protein
MFSPQQGSTESSRGWQPWGALVPLLGIAFVAVTVVGVTAVLQKVGLVDADENPVGLRGFAVFLTLPFAALGVALLAWVRFVERRTLAAIGLGGNHPARIFLGGLGTGLAMVLAIVAGIWVFGGVRLGALAPAFGVPGALGGIGLLLIGFAFQSSIEELFFRGWMLSAIALKFRLVFAVLLSSLAFTVLHWDPRANGIFKANVLLFAIFACCWVIRTGNVWGVMGWHGAWNWLLAVGFEMRVTALDSHLPALVVKLTPTGPEYLTGGIEGPEGSIVCSVALICGIAFQLWFARYRKLRQQATLNENSN